MSVVLDSTSNQYLRTTTVPVTSKPVTLAAWYKTTSNALMQTPVCISNAANNEFILAQLRGAVAGDYVAVQEYATAWKWSPTIGYTINTWQHVAVVFYSATDRRVFLNGANKVTNTETQDVDFDLFDQVLVGTHKTVGGTPFAGKLAEIAIWSTDLTDAEILELAEGTLSDSIQATDLGAYWKLKSDAKDSVGSNDLTLHNAPTWDSTDSPPVFNYPISTGVNLGKTVKRLVAAGNDIIYYEDV